MRRITIWGPLLVAVLAGCQRPMGAPDPGVEPGVQQEPPDVVRAVKLQAFTGATACGAAEQVIEEAAIHEMRLHLEAYKSGVGGVHGGDGGVVAGPGGGGGPGAYSQTNVQVAGVDEPDLMKNDGTRIFTLSGGVLYALQSWPARQLAVKGRLAVPGARELFLSGNKVVVLSDAVYPGSVPSSSPWGGGSSATRITFVDVTALAAPTVVREVLVPGRYLSARRVDGSVRLVVRDGLRYPSDVQWWPSGAPAGSPQLAQQIDALIAANERAIRARTLADWIPPVISELGNGQTVLTPQDCAQLSSSNATSRMGVSSIVTLDLDNPARIDRSSVLTAADLVYASAGALYLVVQHHWWWQAAGQQDATYLHKFDISRPDRAPHLASGVFDGVVVDQFSLDEHEGYLRVATAVTRSLASGDVWRRESVNRVVVLGESDGALVEVGRTSDLAAGERIQSARFLGDRGFVVTFRQVDPLFTFDLADPTQPKKLGELKVPGFSSYLHPVDARHLLGVGTYVPESGDFSQRGVQLSLFDVQDMSAPRQTFTLKLGGPYAHSEAQWEHRAFTWLPERQRFAMPYSETRYDGPDESQFVSELQVFQVDAVTGIAPQGTLPMTDTQSSPTGYWWYRRGVRRSVLTDGFVYAISDAAVRVAHQSDLSRPIATVLLAPEV